MLQEEDKIVLVPLTSGQPHQDDNETDVRIQNSHMNDTSGAQQQQGLRRFISSIDRPNLYKNLLLWVVLLGCLFLIAAPFGLHFAYILPAVKSRTVPLTEFSEERARDYFPNLTQYGPRVCNTQADYLTRAFLLSQLDRIRAMARPSLKFEINLQNYTTEGVEDLQNIIVRLSRINTTYDTPCLMLSAHYDSVEFSPGGTDDGSGTIILLELLTNLVNDPVILYSEIQLIVFFSSAEEMGLDGSDAFVNYHNWTANVRRFINIDSSGSKDRAILFRVKPSQLVNDYKSVPRPHANVIGDELLELTGSDTDYSSFSEKGSLFGYDFAYYLDGYNYHTPLDKPSIMEDGAIQHLGDNLLALSRNILLGYVNLKEPATIIDDDHVIYFDVLGRHLVAYKQSTAIMIQGILIGLVIVIGIVIIIIDHIWHNKDSSSADYNSVYYYFKYPLLIRILLTIIFFIGYVLSIVIGVLLAVFIAFLTSKIRPLSYFGNPTLAIFLYGLPCLIGIILCEMFWLVLRRLLLSKYPKKYPEDNYKINHVERTCLNFERYWGLLLVYVLLMICSIVIPYRSLYFILLWSIFVCPIYLLIILFESISRWVGKKIMVIFNDPGWYWLFAPYIVSLIPLIHSLELSSRLLRLAIPLMGRAFYPIELAQDFLICAGVVAPAVLFFLIFIPNIQRAMIYSGTLIILVISFLIVFIIACTTQPYTSTHPKLIRPRHVSESVYTLNTTKNFPMTILMDSQRTQMTVESFDKLAVSPAIEEIFSKTGFVLRNLTCSTKTKCLFDDTTNRTLAFQEIELTSVDILNNYRFTIHHASSYQIDIYPSKVVDFTVENSTMKPRSVTVINVRPINSSTSFNLNVTVERCDINDSPFIMSLFQKLPHIVTWGGGRCRTIKDTLSLFVTV